jgi:FMN-dependent NADH-azoreductase
MATLLHIDSSLFPDASVSRDVAATFVNTWKAEHPDGTVIHRDLAAEPVPHLDGALLAAGQIPAEDRTPEQVAALELRETLITELEQADAVLIGAPMYNFGVPSTLKAWIDQVIVVGRTAGAEGKQTTAGIPTTVIVSRGGGYGAGTPREGWEFTETFMRKFGEFLGLDLHVVVAELTLARRNPAMADLIDKADEVLAAAHESAGAKAKELAARAAAA